MAVVFLVVALQCVILSVHMIVWSHFDCLILCVSTVSLQPTLHFPQFGFWSCFVEHALVFCNFGFMLFLLFCFLSKFIIKAVVMASPPKKKPTVLTDLTTCLFSGLHSWIFIDNLLISHVFFVTVLYFPCGLNCACLFQVVFSGEGDCLLFCLNSSSFVIMQQILRTVRLSQDKHNYSFF